ncbi:DUF3857 and transglutaminase domain-containing protein [Pseudomonas sp.]|uniref:DUF3857 domain-containing transglutaminase family protein n=1 Tax=Pseudomonas sp. TaxID=306 RepID=UPI0028AAD9BE|nr:DUF3857 and transglutaminase domain-containing protein [Pseudomonas sp.]
MFPTPRIACLRAVFACALLLLISTWTHADGTDPSVTLEKDLQHFTVNADGSFVLAVESVVLINQPSAVQARAQQPLSYNRAIETLDVVEAYTLKADGRKVPVGPEQIREQQEAASSEAPMFRDALNKVVIFPEVAVGDRLVLRYQRTRSTALFPGQFEDLSAAAMHPIGEFSITYDLPEGLPLHAEARGFNAVPAHTANGRTVYRWNYQVIERARIESGAVSYLDHGQYLAVSTFADFKQFAEAYQARARVEVTPAIREMARQLTAKLPTARDKVLALSDWVRTHIRYVAVYVGAGGVVPHPAQTVLDNRYGDCKGHVALLEALLKAVGIDSTPALVNLGNAYTLPSVPTLGVFNHVLTYVPSLDLYLDSTDVGIAAGYLPLGVLDKPVLLTASGALARTPATQMSEAQGELSFKVDRDGAAHFQHDTRVRGWASEFTRYHVAALSAGQREALIQQVLAAYGQRGSGVLSVQPLQADGVFRTRFTGHSENLVNLPGPVGVMALSTLGGGIAQTVYGFTLEKQRRQGFQCFSGTTVERARFEFPPEVNVLALPKPVALQDSSLDYSAHYRREGNSVLIERQMRFHHPRAVCSPEDFKRLQPAIDSMVRDLQSQIIVQAS